MRMDKYEENKKYNTLSREYKNREMYDDVYKNDIDDDNTIIKEKNDIEEIKYNQKSYDINEYLDYAHKLKDSDNLKRELDIDNDVINVSESKDEISIIINNIENEEEDLFSDLIENTNDLSQDIKLTSIVSTQIIETKAIKNNKDDEDTFDDIENTKKNKINKKILILIISILIILTIIGILIYLFIK